MNFVADECVPRPIVERLRTDGHSVAWITQEHPGISDPAVLQLSIAASATLLTIDTDFGELIFRTNQASIGVVLLRLEASPTL